MYLFLLPRILQTPACQAFSLRLGGRLKVRKVYLPQDLPEEGYPDEGCPDEGMPLDQQKDTDHDLTKDTDPESDAQQTFLDEAASTGKDPETPDIKEYKYTKDQ
jgi:hypothetical protein